MADGVFFVTDKEADLFRRLAPESAHQVETVGNGVDADYFEVDPARRSPFLADELPIVFTGAMDYWPNVDAVCWFVQEVLPDAAGALALDAIPHRRPKPCPEGACPGG